MDWQLVSYRRYKLHHFHNPFVPILIRKNVGNVPTSIFFIRQSHHLPGDYLFFEGLSSFRKLMKTSLPWRAGKEL